MTFAQRRNRLKTHFTERIPVVKRRISVVLCHDTVLYGIWILKVVEERLRYGEGHFLTKLLYPHRRLTASYTGKRP